jgi:hypothetical protein
VQGFSSHRFINQPPTLALPVLFILSFEQVNSSGYAAFKQRLSLLATGGSPDQWMQDIKVNEGGW